MFITLGAGEQLRIGEAVTLTVLAVEDGLVHFGLEVPGPALPYVECPDAENEETDPAQPRS